MPAHARVAQGAALLAAAACVAAGSTGCGPPPPQVPVPQAGKVTAALAGITAACGESYQQHALAPMADESGVLESAASMRASELAGVYRKGPEWIYNGETLQQIVALSIRDLRECDLGGAAAALERQTR